MYVELQGIIGIFLKITGIFPLFAFGLCRGTHKRAYMRSYIYTRCKLGIIPRYIHEELVHVYGTDAPSLIQMESTLFWRQGDRQRISSWWKPHISLTASLMQTENTLIVEDQNLDLRFLSSGLGVSYGSVYIFHWESKRWGI